MNIPKISKLVRSRNVILYVYECWNNLFWKLSALEINDMIVVWRKLIKVEYAKGDKILIKSKNWWRFDNALEMFVFRKLRHLSVIFERLCMRERVLISFHIIDLLSKSSILRRWRSTRKDRSYNSAFKPYSLRIHCKNEYRSFVHLLLFLCEQVISNLFKEQTNVYYVNTFKIWFPVLCKWFVSSSWCEANKTSLELG